MKEKLWIIISIVSLLIAIVSVIVSFYILEISLETNEKAIYIGQQLEDLELIE